MQPLGCGGLGGHADQPLKHGDPEWKGEGQDGLRGLTLRSCCVCFY